MCTAVYEKISLDLNVTLKAPEMRTLIIQLSQAGFSKVNATFILFGNEGRPIATR